MRPRHVELMAADDQRHLGGESDIRVGVGGWEVQGRHCCLRNWTRRELAEPESQLLTPLAPEHSSSVRLLAHRAGKPPRFSFRPTRARPYGVRMSLTLITGPANAAKAGVVLERLRAALPRDPVLVVPTSADATHYSRELAGAGLVFGTEVTTFPRLTRDIARAAGIRTRPLGKLATRQVLRATIDGARLTALARSAKGPGFAEALGELFAELQRSLVTPARFGAAIRAWVSAGTAPAHAQELQALYSAYHARLDALETLDADGLTHLALNAAREVWDGRPLFLYGFDELLPTQLDLVESLTRHTSTDITVALTYEPGRAALAGSAATVETLKPLAREHLTLEPRSEHYAASARGALHHLERNLFEPQPRRVPPNGAVRLLEAGGERAEAELVGASVLELLRDGMAPEDIAVLVRGRAADGALRAGLRGLRHPGRLRAPHPVRPDAPRPRPPGLRPRRAPRRHRRRRRHLAPHPREAQPPGPGRPPRGPGPPPRGPHDPRRAPLLDPPRRPRPRRAHRAHRTRPPGRRRAADVSRRAPARGRRDLDGAPRPARGRALPRGRGRRAGRPGAAGGGEGAHPARRGRPRAGRRSAAAAGGAGDRRGARQRGGRGSAGRPARRPAGHPRAAVPGRDRVRTAGGRPAAAAGSRAVPRRRRAGRAGRSPPGSCCRATRTRSPASARSSTRASRGPRRRCS